MQTQNEKILFIRFSSFGDVTQALSVPSLMKEYFHDAEIQWVTREDMAPLIQGHPSVSKTWQLNRRQGLIGLIQLAKKLRAEKFTRIYDAHNNLRSHILTFLLRWPFFGSLRPLLLRRSLRRWKRFLLFRFRINKFQMPFSGQRDLAEPLEKWGISFHLPPVPQLFLTRVEIEKWKNLLPKEFIALAPSAAYELKRWPLDNWKELILNLSSQRFVLLGGPQDLFLNDLFLVAPERVLNLAGQTALRESAAVLAQAQVLVSNDTGLLHVAEQLGKPAIALMGPAPFGFPSRKTTKILELNLSCRPCSKHGQGPCVNPQFQQCLRGIKVADVVAELGPFMEG